MSADGAVPAVRTTCPYCGVGCGLLASVGTDGAVEIRGDTAHPANFGRLCSKGSALGETVGLEGRLLYPLLKTGDAMQRVSWDRALGHVAEKFKAVIAEHGPDAVAFYVSGQLLTEDYYVANKLMKGWIGTANIDTNSRLCMSSAVAGYVRAFGEDVVPCSYEDLELADLIVLVGSNTAWCHPVLYQRILAARERRPQMKIVVIDPRRTSTCEIADLYLPLRAGSDVALFNGLLSHLDAGGFRDAAFVDERTQDLRETLREAGNQSLGDIAESCGLDVEQLSAFYALFGQTERVVTAFSMGVNQSSSGADKVNAIINCHLLTGRIGRAGMGPFSITGQPNAMGGREVGGMANMLAAHLSLEAPAHRALVQNFWNSPRIADKPGLKAVDLFEAIHNGRVKAVWIIATNPVVSLPDADRAREALRRCELVVVSDCIADTDTARLAHVLLPAAAWGEKDGTVTNTERRISRQRAFLSLPGDARPDWWAISELAKRMDCAEGFDYSSAHEIFVEHAALSAAGNHQGKANSIFRVFNLAGLAELDAAAYDVLEPVQWPVAKPVLPDHAASMSRDSRHPLADFPNGRARFVPTAARAPVNAPDEAWPLVLNTGRVRDHWHTMTRTGRAPRLAAHTPAPFVTMHVDDALAAGIVDGQLARVSTRWGALTARARVGGEVARGAIFVPIHWNDTVASDARVGALVNPAVDPVSGEPEFKHTPAKIEAYAARWYGFALTRRAANLQGVDWWARAAGIGHHSHELAGTETPADWPAFARDLLGIDGGDWLEYEDQAAGAYRAVVLKDGRLDACIFSAASPALSSQAWLAQQFLKERVEPNERAALLAGREAGGVDAGPLVCSCFGVCRNTILTAIRDDRLSTPQQIGRKLQAGTNCGSCLPELRMLLVQATAASS